MHPDAQLLGSLPLRGQQIAAVCREDVVMVEDRGAAVLHQLAHGGQGCQALSLLGQVLPDLVERHQPVEELQVLDLRQIAGEDLVQVMVRVDKTRIGDHSGRVYGAVRLDVQTGTDLPDDPVLAQQVHMLRHGIRRVAGDDSVNISDKQCSHNISSLL